MSKKELDKYISQLELIDATKKFSAYYNPESQSIAIYNGKDIYEASVDRLGEALFEDKEE